MVKIPVKVHGTSNKRAVAEIFTREELVKDNMGNFSSKENEEFRVSKQPRTSAPASETLIACSTICRPPMGSTEKKEENRTLWVGDLDKAADSVEVDDSYVTLHMFYEFSHNISRVKVCKDRVTGTASYAFVEFKSQKVAQYCIENLNHRWVPGRIHKYKLNWATFNVSDPRRVASNSHATKIDDGNGKAQQSDDGKNRAGHSSANSSVTASIWVGSLDPSISKEELEEIFLQYYKSVVNAKVALDPITQTGRGFGFVHFDNIDEAERALEEMNGFYLRGKRIKVNRSYSHRELGTSSKLGKNDERASGSSNTEQRYVQSVVNKLYDASISDAQKNAYQCGYVQTKRKKASFSGASQKLVIRGIDAYCTEEVLSRHFSAFGQLLGVKVVHNRNKGYVTFSEAEAAQNALHFMHGAYIGGVRVSVEFMGTGKNDVNDTVLGDSSFLEATSNFTGAYPGFYMLEANGSTSHFAPQLAPGDAYYDNHYHEAYGIDELGYGGTHTLGDTGSYYTYNGTSYYHQYDPQQQFGLTYQNFSGTEAADPVVAYSESHKPFSSSRVSAPYNFPNPSNEDPNSIQALFKKTYITNYEEPVVSTLYAAPCALEKYLPCNLAAESAFLPSELLDPIKASDCTSIEGALEYMDTSYIKQFNLPSIQSTWADLFDAAVATVKHDGVEMLRCLQYNSRQECMSNLYRSEYEALCH